MVPKKSEVRAERCRRSLAFFIREFWPVLEPETQYHHNWHIDVICQHLENITRGLKTPEGIKRLIVNIPPGHMKSLIMSVFWPAWVWIERPGIRMIFASYAQDLAMRDSVRCRDLLLSELYQEYFKPDWTFSEDQNTKGFYENTRRGSRLSLGVGGKATGFRGDIIVVDDPLNAKEKDSEVARHEAIFWWDKVMSSRLNDQKAGVKVVIMQRLHEEDLTGHLLSKGGYEHLCLPSEFDARHPSKTSIWQDPRRADGELLFPSLFPSEVLQDARIALGEEDYQAQHGQKPAPADGLIFKTKHIQFWVPRDHAHLMGQPVTYKNSDGEYFQAPMKLLPWTLEELRRGVGLSTQCQSWDMTFKNTATSAFVVGQVWGSEGADKFLLDQVRDRWDFPGTIDAVLGLSKLWPKALAKLIEDKANGPAVMSTLKGKLAGLTEVEPYGDKIARSYAVAPAFNAKNVWLPHPALYPWVTPFIHRLLTFPNAKFKDEIDALTQGLQYLLHAIAAFYEDLDDDDLGGRRF